MRVVVLLVLVTGCALGRVGPDGELVGLAVGHSRLEACREGYEDEDLQQSVAGGERCAVIEGGALSTGAAELLSTIGTAVGAYFGLM